MTMKATKEYRLSLTGEAKELVSKMSLEEKVRLMSGRATIAENAEAFSNPTADNHYNVYPYPAGGNDRLGVPELLFCDGPRGVVVEKSTCFPVTMARGASFDPELEREVGEAIAKEIRAYGANFFGGVCINLPYNPGWGRSQETYGEDDFHLGVMGSALVRGVQEHNVIACIKHFAFNSMENARFTVSVDADLRTEREVYLRHFEECVKAGAASVMSSYNRYKGVYCGQQKHLLRDVLKGEWDFDGFVVSDFIWGTRDTVRAANGGLDVEMCDTNYFGDKLVRAVRDGDVPEAAIDEAALRITRTLLAFERARAEDPQEYPRTLVASVPHIELAKKAARKSMTLIKNDGGVLPFRKDRVRTVAVMGSLANTRNTGDHGSSWVFPPYVVTPVEGVTELLPGAAVVCYAGTDEKRAAEIARAADAVIFVVGCRHDDEGEYIAPTGDGIFGHSQGGDRRETLGIAEADRRLIRAAAPVNPNTAVVLVGGSMIMIDDWKDAVPSILMAYYPGMEGGTVIAETLFGDNNPGGKLPFVIVKKESDLPAVDWNAEEITYGYHHGYAKLEKEGVKPSVPYGFGLSYTRFSIADPEFSVAEGEVIARCTVKNIGDREGDEVVQLYVGLPLKSLRGFQRVALPPGAQTRVEIRCPAEKLAWFNEDHWELEHREYAGFIGSSSDEADLLAGTFTL